MPPISPQGSRTGLVTALVIFVILFVTSTILFIYENAERRNLQERVQNLESQRADLATEAVMTSPEVTQLMESARAASPPQTAVEAMLAQRRKMAKTISGQELPPDKVDVAVKAAMDRATAKDIADANVRVTRSNGLTEVVTALANGIAQLSQQRQELQQQLQAAADERAQIVKARDELVAAKDKEIAAVRGEMEQGNVQLATFRQQNLGTVKNVQSSATAALTQQQESNAQLSSQLNQATTTITKLQQQLEQVTNRLKGTRVGVNEATIQKADGHIVRVPDNETVIIDLGLGDQIVKGMTFEVYDSQKGIPALGDGMRDGDMPEGKASIEVIEMGPGYSRCRVIRRKPGYGLVIGDLIANLVYDSTQKYNFVVYGNFDLNNDGRADSADADVIKRVITRWGGNVTNEVNINTDFVVMGKEPKAEPILKDDDAVVKQQKTEAQAAYDQYMNVLKQASSLNIPIMNQNRFLNFVGYASQANR
jgi:hypothetical protein